MKKLLLTFLLLPSLGVAQDSLSYEPTATASPRPVVMHQQPVFKLAPFSLLDIDPTMQAAIEIPLKQRLSIQQEIGIGWPRLGLANYQKSLTTTEKRSFRARTEIRYYFSPDLSRKGLGKSSTNGFYAAGELLNKRITITDRNRSSVLSGQPAFLIPPREQARIQRQIYGLHAKIGYQGILSPKHPQFVVDVYVGAGFRVVSVRQLSGSPTVGARGLLNSDAMISRFAPFDGWRYKPSLSGGVKLGWMINTGKKVKKK